MTDHFNDKGDIKDLTTIACIDHIKVSIKGRFECLIDSGAEPMEIKAVAQKVCEAIGEASNEAIAGWLIQLEIVKGGENGDVHREGDNEKN